MLTLVHGLCNVYFGYSETLFAFSWFIVFWIAEVAGHMPCELVRYYIFDFALYDNTMVLWGLCI